MEASSSTNKTPLDLKLLSILFFLSAFVYFLVNTNIFLLYGIVLSGKSATILWIISCSMCLICSYGLWTKKAIIWKVLIGYSVFYLGNSVINYFLIPAEQRSAIAMEKVSVDISYSNSLYFFLFYVAIYVLFIFYLIKRKKVFRN